MATVLRLESLGSDTGSVKTLAMVEECGQLHATLPCHHPPATLQQQVTQEVVITPAPRPAAGQKLTLQQQEELALQHWRRQQSQQRRGGGGGGGGAQPSGVQRTHNALGQRIVPVRPSPLHLSVSLSLLGAG
jgi:hypothetical protein